MLRTLFQTCSSQDSDRFNCLSFEFAHDNVDIDITTRQRRVFGTHMVYGICVWQHWQRMYIPYNILYLFCAKKDGGTLKEKSCVSDGRTILNA